MINLVIRRGDIYYADLRPVVGSEQGGIRPVIVVQNEAGNKHSSTVIDKQRLKEKVCHVDSDVLKKVDEALKISLELV